MSPGLLLYFVMGAVWLIVILSVKKDSTEGRKLNAINIGMVVMGVLAGLALTWVFAATCHVVTVGPTADGTHLFLSGWRKSGEENGQNKD